MKLETAVTTLLDQRQIEYKLLPHAEPAFTCEEAAVQRGVPLGEMVKCLVLLVKKSSPIVVCLAADRRLSLRKTKKQLGIKSFSMATPEDILRVTGFELGSIPPIGLPDSLRVLGDKGLATLARVNISSGNPTCGVELSGADFRQLLIAQVLDLAE